MTTIEIDRSSLGTTTGSEARTYAARLAAALDVEHPENAPHKVALGDGGSLPEGYQTTVQRAWSEFCNA